MHSIFWSLTHLHCGAGSIYRFIGEETTITSSDDWGQLVDHEGLPVLPAEGAESNEWHGGGEDLEFVHAIRNGTRGLTSVADCLPVMRIIDQLQRSMDSKSQSVRSSRL